jgi:hypothetical protein
VLSAETPGADIEASPLSLYHQSDPLDIGHPAPLGMPLGVADIMTKLRGLATNLTFSCQNYLPFPEITLPNIFTGDSVLCKMLAIIIPYPHKGGKSKSGGRSPMSF